MRKSYPNLQGPQRWTMKEDRPMLAAFFFVSSSVHCPLSYCKIGEPQCFMATLSALERGLSSNDKIKSMLLFFFCTFFQGWRGMRSNTIQVVKHGASDA